MKRVAYWVCTGLVVFFIGSGGLAYAMKVPDVVQGVVALGFPVHFIVLLGVWKVLGSIAILVPGFPLIKEWAYAGIMIDLTGAAYSLDRDRWRVVARRRAAGRSRCWWRRRGHCDRRAGGCRARRSAGWGCGRASRVA